MKKDIETAGYSISQWVYKMLRDYGNDALGAYDVTIDDIKLTEEDIPALNAELTKYEGKPDEKGKVYKIEVESITRISRRLHYNYGIRIRYVKA